MTDQAQTVELTPADSVRFEPGEWEARAADVHRAAQEDGETPREAVTEVLRTLRLTDPRGATWFYDGATWFTWDGQQWRPGRPDGALRLTPFVMDLVPEPDEQPPLGLPRLEDAPDEPFDELRPPEATQPRLAPPTPAPAPDPGGAFRPTHAVPPSGLPVWSQPDPAAAPVATLDPALPVAVVEQLAGGWSRVLCSNGWSGWVDGRRLLPI